MPRNVRPFWYSLAVDGRQHAIATGPRSGHGGVRGTIEQRHQGTIARAHLELSSGGSGIEPDKLLTRVYVRGQIEADPERGPFAYILRADGTREPLGRNDALVLETLR